MLPTTLDEIRELAREVMLGVELPKTGGDMDKLTATVYYFDSETIRNKANARQTLFFGSVKEVYNYLVGVKRGMHQHPVYATDKALDDFQADQIEELALKAEGTLEWCKTRYGRERPLLAIRGKMVSEGMNKRDLLIWLRGYLEAGEDLNHVIAEPEIEGDMDSDVWIVKDELLARHLFKTIHGEDEFGGRITYYDKAGTGYTTENGTFDALPPFKKEQWEAAARSIIALLPEAGS